jgi:hypothetical protein
MSMGAGIILDSDGREFLALEIIDGHTKVQTFLGYADTAQKNVDNLYAVLRSAIKDMKGTPTKNILVAEGNLKNGIRTTQRGVKLRQGTAGEERPREAERPSASNELR